MEWGMGDWRRRSCAITRPEEEEEEVKAEIAAAAAMN